MRIKQFGNLLKKANIGEVEIRNRIVMPPMGARLGDEDGSVNDRVVTYYEERAKGGAGLIIVEYSFVHPAGKAEA